MPAFAPVRFICNNYWQTCAQHHVDVLVHAAAHLYTQQRFDPKAVKDGDRVFVKTDLIDMFIARLLPLIRARFVLITGHSDLSPGEWAMLQVHRCPRITQWYAVNAIWTDHKTIALPMGLSEPDRPNGDQDVVARVLASLSQTDEKLDGVFCPVASPTHPVRAELQALHHPALLKTESRMSYEEYLRALARHRFVLCPRGNGIDVHRVYEALIMRTIPIYVTDTVPALFHRVGMPVLVVQSIKDLVGLLDDLPDWTPDWDAVLEFCTAEAAGRVYGLA